MWTEPKNRDLLMLQNYLLRFFRATFEFETASTCPAEYGVHTKTLLRADYKDESQIIVIDYEKLLRKTYSLYKLHHSVSRKRTWGMGAGYMFAD